MERTTERTTEQIIEQGCGNQKTANASDESGGHVSEVSIGNTVFVVTSECSTAATETIEQKLMRMMNRHVCEDQKPPTFIPLKNQAKPAM